MKILKYEKVSLGRDIKLFYTDKKYLIVEDVQGDLIEVMESQPPIVSDVTKLINDYWKFDNDQQHCSTWHDKNDLIEAISKLAPVVSDEEIKNWLVESHFNIVPSNAGKYLEVISKAVNHFKLSQTPGNAVSKWISVEDRLPEPNTKVIVFKYYSEKYQEVTTACFYKDAPMTQDGWSDLSYDKISHWKPLPQPPTSK